MGSALDIAAVLALLQSGETVLVPSSHAAQALRFQFDTAQRHHGLHAWEPAPVSCWTEWTEALWSTLALNGYEDRVLLNRLQEEALWAEIIATFPQGRNLEPNAVWEMASLARSALQLLAENNATNKVRPTSESPDVEAFTSFHRAFLQRCERDALVARALLEGELAVHAERGHLALPSTLHLVGFAQVTPAQQHLLDTVNAASCHITGHVLRSAAAPTTPTSHIAPDPHQELEFAVRWIRERAQNSPELCAPIALIFPDPAKERAELEPLLRELLAPELESVRTDLSSAPWHFSTGSALSSLPVITHALLLLRWAYEPLPIEKVRALLFSPFFHQSESLDERARFEMHTLRRALIVRPELSLDMVVREARHATPPVPLAAWNSVRRLTSEPNERPKIAPHAYWTEQIRKLLHAAGWPGPRTLSPLEFRTTERWESLLDLLATLDLHGTRVAFPALLDLLNREARGMTVPEATAAAPVQIITLDEAEACVFDSVLILRATDEHMPKTEHTHPLLDWKLQHALQLPGTDPALTYARTHSSLVSLSGRSGTLLLSAAQEGQNGPLRFTPLAAELRIFAASPQDSIAFVQLEKIALRLDVAIDDDPLPPLASGETPGGARVLELQAACGFRAFAAQRLGAKMPEGKALGLDARQIGKILHTAMDMLWSALKNQEQLKQLAAHERLALTQQSVSHALQRYREKAPSDTHWTEAYFAIAQQNLTDLLNRWLDLELRRAPFEVLSREEEQTIQVGPLQLRVRPDRVDKVDNRFVYIDYKTSSQLSTNDWLGERPDAPQLPLYVLLRNPDEIRGLAFARLRRGKDMDWVSLDDTPGTFPAKSKKTEHDIAELIATWRTELSRLAFEFADGKTNVQPKQYPNTCKYCEHRLLCRLEPVTMLADADGDTEQGAGGARG